MPAKNVRCTIRLTVATAVSAATLLITGIGPATAQSEATIARSGAGRTVARDGARAALTAVSCQGPSFCLAVGWTAERSAARKPLIEKWNGTAWHVLPATLERIFTSVTCGSATFCMANSKAGYALWNGASWRPLPEPPHLGFIPVSCGSPTSCMYGSPQGRIWRWSGGRWRVQGGIADICGQGAPGPCGWSTFTCGGGSCMAIGFFTTNGCCDNTTEWTDYWTGKKWTGVADPPVDGTLGCGVDHFCMEVEPQPTGLGQAATWQLNPGGWQDASPNSSICNGIANCSWGPNLTCGNPKACVLFGGLRLPLVPLIWNGTTWTAEPFAPATGAAWIIQDVSCASKGTCTAVGDKTTASGTKETLAERWNGTTWQVVTTPKP